MNKTLMAKLGWRILREKDSLWAKVILKIYTQGGANINNLRGKNVPPIFGKGWFLRGKMSPMVDTHSSGATTVSAIHPC